MERKARFNYLYVDMGSIAGSGNDKALEIKADRVFLDVGNGLFKGVIDHHHKLEGENIQGTIYRSAARLVTVCSKYITDNITEAAEEIEIILHKAPDFDCYASSYLTRKLLLNGCFPEGYEEFVSYADEVDAGKIKINKDNMKELFAVGYAIEDVIRDMLSGERKQLQELKNTSRDKRYEEMIRERWYLLFDYTLDWLKMNKGRTLKGTDIFGMDSIFNPEVEFIRKDYNDYREDIKEKGKCLEITVRLPRIGDMSGKLYEVDGLVYNKAPGCRLHKCWARSDSSAPSGEGYIFTFIPKEGNTELVLNNENGVPERIRIASLPIYMNKAVISLDPNSGYCLKGMAEQLEQAEVEKENLIFENDKSKMRCRNKRRPGFYDSWCTNDDPWYDGRNFCNTIIDAPRRGSLLTIEEIKEIALDFTTARVEKSTTRLIIPFSFNHDLYSSLIKKMSSDSKGCSGQCDIANDKGLKQNEVDMDMYFLPYIRNYLFCRPGTGKGPQNCIRFKMQVDKLVEVCGEVPQIVGTGGSQNKNESARIISEDIVLFKYGVGFVCMDFEQIIKGRKTIKNILGLNHGLVYGFESIKSCIDIEKYRNEIDFDFSSPLVYTTVTLLNKGFYESEKREILYKLCNRETWEAPYTNSEYIETVLGNLFMDLDGNVVYGFSKSGGALLCTGSNCGEEKSSIHVNQRIGYFNSIYFEIFLFALHQRCSLMKFSNMLSEFDKKRKSSDIMRLRGIIMNFTTQGWFSQITNNEIGQEVYRRWETVFECKNLYDEILEQVESVDEYNHAKTSRMFEIISIVAFPILFVAQFLSSGLIKTKTIGPVEGFDWWYTVLFTLVSMGILFFFMRIKRGK